MCYNVLCDMYCTRQLYAYCPSWALSWQYRKKTIIEEIRQYSPDILTLQVRQRARRTSHLAPSGCRSQMNRPSFIDVFAVVTDKS